MTEEQRLQRQVRIWLYVIAALHIVYLALLHRPVPKQAAATPLTQRAAVTPAHAPFHPLG
jgi:hypothetical protein